MDNQGKRECECEGIARRHYRSNPVLNYSQTHSIQKFTSHFHHYYTGHSSRDTLMGQKRLKMTLVENVIFELFQAVV